MALERDKLIAERSLPTLGQGELLELYRRMSLIRRFEDKAAEMYTRSKITGFCHLYTGEKVGAVVRNCQIVVGKIIMATKPNIDAPRW